MEVFVDYKTGLALKELGFDEPCFYQYVRDFDNNVELIPIVSETNYPILRNNTQVSNCSGGDCFAAPLKQQAFRWFRDKHDIQTLIKRNKSDHVWYRYEIYFERLATGENPPVMVGHTINSWLGLNLEFKTYEEAEDACINKIIELIKNK